MQPQIKEHTSYSEGIRGARGNTLQMPPTGADLGGW